MASSIACNTTAIRQQQQRQRRRPPAPRALPALALALALASMCYTATAADSFVLRNLVTDNGPVCTNQVEDAAFGTIELAQGTCIYNIQGPTAASDPGVGAVQNWQLAFSGVVDRTAVILSSSAAHDGSLNALLPPIVKGIDFTVTIPAVDVPNGVFLMLNNFYDNNITVEVTSIISCAQGYTPLSVYHSMADDTPFYSACVPTPTPGITSTTSLVITSTLDWNELPPSCAELGFYGELIFPAGSLTGERVTVTFIPANNTVLALEASNMLNASANAVTDGDIVVPPGDAIITLELEVMPRDDPLTPDAFTNVVSLATSTNTGGNGGNGGNGQGMPTIIATTVDLAIECPSLATRTDITGNFLYAHYANTAPRSCTFFMPLFLMDGSMVTSYNIEPLSLDGVSSIDIFDANASATEPILTIVNTTRVQLPSYFMAAAGGMLVTINAAGNNVPLSVIISTTVECQPCIGLGCTPPVLVSLVNAQDLGWSGMGDMAADAPLSFCVDAGVTQGAGSGVMVNVSFSMSSASLPPYPNTTFLLVLQPDSSGLLPGYCYAVGNLTSPAVAAATFLYPNATGVAPMTLVSPTFCIPAEGIRDVQILGTFTADKANIDISAQLSLNMLGPQSPPTYPPVGTGMYPPTYAPPPSPPKVDIATVPPSSSTGTPDASVRNGASLATAPSVQLLLSFLLASACMLLLLQ